MDIKDNMRIALFHTVLDFKALIQSKQQQMLYWNINKMKNQKIQLHAS